MPKGILITFEGVETELCCEDFIKIINKKRVVTAGGDRVLLTSLKWNRHTSKATISGRIQKTYTTNLSETFVEDGKGTLHDYHSDDPREDVAAAYPDVAARMERMARAYYESARYIRYHNAPAR